MEKVTKEQLSNASRAELRAIAHDRGIVLDSTSSRDGIVAQILEGQKDKKFLSEPSKKPTMADATNPPKNVATAPNPAAVKDAQKAKAEGAAK